MHLQVSANDALCKTASTELPGTDRIVIDYQAQTDVENDFLNLIKRVNKIHESEILTKHDINFVGKTGKTRLNTANDEKHGFRVERVFRLSPNSYQP